MLLENKNAVIYADGSGHHGAGADASTGQKHAAHPGCVRDRKEIP